MNTTNLLGRLTRDIELKEFGETKVAQFTLAINRKFKKDESDFITCKAFNKTAEILSQYCKKGNQLAVVGRIQTGSYEKEGTRVYTTDVIVESFTFVSSKNDNKGDAYEGNNSKKNEFYEVDEDDDEFPF